MTREVGKGLRTGFRRGQGSLQEAEPALTAPPLCAPPGRPRPRADTPGPQPQPMDLRVGQRPPVEPPPEPALLALQPPQRLHHHLFFAGLQPRSAESMRVSPSSRTCTHAPTHARGSLELRPQPPPPFSLPSPSAQPWTPCPFPAHSSRWTHRCPSCRWGSRSRSCGSFSTRTRASEVRTEASPARVRGLPAGARGLRWGPRRPGPPSACWAQPVNVGGGLEASRKAGVPGSVPASDCEYGQGGG